jgi:limonene-1,2-epoxide hydrolase
MDPIEIAFKVMDAFESLDFEKNLYGLLDDDVVYQNMPQTPIYGKDAVRRLFDSFGNVSSIRFDRLNAAANGDTVFCEHLDHMVINGSEVVIPMTSIYTLKNGKIVRWREYYDMNTFERQLGHRHPGAT